MQLRLLSKNLILIIIARRVHRPIIRLMRIIIIVKTNMRTQVLGEYIIVINISEGVLRGIHRLIGVLKDESVLVALFVGQVVQLV